MNPHDPYVPAMCTTPATGFYAIYDCDGEIRAFPLTFWLTVSYRTRDGDTGGVASWTDPMINDCDGYLEKADDAIGFLAILHESELPEGLLPQQWTMEDLKKKKPTK